MKKIIVKWYKTTNDQMYDKEMMVIYSNHKRFKVGTRFDFGFLQIASSDGFIIEIRPMEAPRLESVKHESLL